MLRSPILSRILLLVLAGILMWSSVVAGRAIFRYTQIQEDIARAKEELTILRAETSTLFSKLQEGDDVEALELAARQRLNVKRPHEEVVIIIPGDEEKIIEDALKALVAPEVEEARGFFSRIKKWFQNTLD